MSALRISSHAKKPFYEELPFLPLHVVVALVGGTLATILIGGLFGAILSKIGVLPPRFPVIFNPFIWLPGFFLGFAVNRFVRHRSAPFVGVVGLVFLVGVMFWDVSILKHGGHYPYLTPGNYWDYELLVLFSPSDKACGDSECLGKLFVTAPFVISVAYSIGAWLALRFGKPKTTDQQQDLDAGTHA